MTSSQFSFAREAQSPTGEVTGVSMAALEEGMAALLSQTLEEPMKTMENIVAEMIRETEFSTVKDINSLLKLVAAHHDPEAARDRNQPEWYSLNAMLWTAHPLRHARGWLTNRVIEDHKEWISNDWKEGNFKVLDYACGTGVSSQALAPHVSHIVGIDADQSMVKIYNEIVKRQKHHTCAMQAYFGNLIPHPQTGDVPGVGADRPTRETIRNFDLAIISLGMDCFEKLGVSPSERHRQLVANLKAIIELLGDQGTLLIVDIQKSTEYTGTETGLLKSGFKSTGYHSSEIVEALESMGMDDIEVLDGIRFQWEATAEEKKIWLPAKADEVLFVLKAKRGGMYREWSRMSPEEMAEIEEAARQIFMEEVLSGHYGCTCGHEH